MEDLSVKDDKRAREVKELEILKKLAIQNEENLKFERDIKHV